MGKFMKKTKLTGDVVAVMDVSHSTLGVRTRATTLALQKLQSPELSYLQLRSRKLEKPNPNPNSSSGTSRLAIRACGSVSAHSGSNIRAPGEVNIKPEGETEVFCDFGNEEASFGENNVDLDDRERSTRESTPCSFTRDSNDSITPGSSTRRTIVPNTIQRIMPCAQEIEEFFARNAQEQQRLFSEKYNFDIVNEKPLQGRYEWVRVQP